VVLACSPLPWIHRTSRNGIGFSASERHAIAPTRVTGAQRFLRRLTYHGRAGPSTSFRIVHRRTVSATSKIHGGVLLPSTFRRVILVEGNSPMEGVNRSARGRPPNTSAPAAAHPRPFLLTFTPYPLPPTPGISNRNTVETGFALTHSKQRTVVLSNRNKKPSPRGVPSQLPKAGSTRGIACCSGSRPDHPMVTAPGLVSSQPACLNYTAWVLHSSRVLGITRPSSQGYLRNRKCKEAN
jgi:hypothetical protein